MSCKVNNGGIQSVYIFDTNSPMNGQYYEFNKYLCYNCKENKLSEYNETCVECIREYKLKKLLGEKVKNIYYRKPVIKEKEQFYKQKMGYKKFNQK